jgi:acyl-CoA thioesterase 8
MARVVQTAFPTLLKPPPVDSSKSEIENLLELTQIIDIDKNLYTNTRPLWHPPGARGIYGGAAIAQCLAAAQNTVPRDYTVHSMHCYFVLAGDAEIPIIYHVEDVRSGKSFATRTVQARQRGKVIFTTTISFMKEGSGGKKLVQHETQMPFVNPPDESQTRRDPQGIRSPFESQRIDILNNDSPRPETKKTRQWIRAKGKISPEGGHEAHLAALAYMSDSYFIGTVARVHKLWRIPAGKNKPPQEDPDVLQSLREGTPEKRLGRREIGMMVSLDHTIYFHDPRGFRADDWLFTEMETPWSGDGRGLVYQRIWTRDGKLVASCVQEGVVRLKQDGEEQRPGSKL